MRRVAGIPEGPDARRSPKITYLLETEKHECYR